MIQLLTSGFRDYKDLVQLYIISEDALSQGRPVKEDYIPRYDVNDVFYQQFIFNITGQSRYSCDFMREPLSIELALIAIRTLGVFDH